MAMFYVKKNAVSDIQQAVEDCWFGSAQCIENTDFLRDKYWYPK